MLAATCKRSVVALSAHATRTRCVAVTAAAPALQNRRFRAARPDDPGSRLRSRVRSRSFQSRSRAAPGRSRRYGAALPLRERPGAHLDASRWACPWNTNRVFGASGRARGTGRSRRAPVRERRERDWRSALPDRSSRAPGALQGPGPDSSSRERRSIPSGPPPGASTGRPGERSRTTGADREPRPGAGIIWPSRELRFEHAATTS